MNIAGRRLDPAAVLAAVALAAAGITLLVWLDQLTFWRDEWAFLLHRRGFSADTFLQPHYEHIAISLIATYKTLLELFGMDSPRPFQVVAVAGFVTSVALVFVYVRRRVGGWFALAAILPICVLGPAWDDLLWPFQFGFFATTAAGMGALLCMDRQDRRGDVAATVLLVVAISFSSLGVPFAVGAAVAMILGREWRTRGYVAAVPLVLYALWWIGWGHNADSSLSGQNIATLPGYVLDGFASSISSLLGLGNPSLDVASPLEWGRALLVAAAALGALKLGRDGRVPRQLLVVLAIAVTFWALAGLNASIFREPTSGRYQFMGAIFIVLIAAEVLRGARPSARLAGVVVLISLFAAAGNLSSLHKSWQGLTSFGQIQPADLAALELMRDQVDPAFELSSENSGVDYLGELDAGSYFSAADAFGSPAFTPEELAAAPEVARESADKVFVFGLGIHLAPVDSVPRGNCAQQELRPVPVAVPVPQGGVSLEMASGGSAEVALRRYSTDSFPVILGKVDPENPGAIAIPQDGSDEPWELGASGTGSLRICGAVK